MSKPPLVCCAGCGRDTKNHGGYCAKCRPGKFQPPPTGRTVQLECDERPFSSYWEDMQTTAIYESLGYQYEADDE